MNVSYADEKNHESPSSRAARRPFPEGSVIIIGAGHFGKRAVDVLSARQHARFWVVDKDEDALGRISAPMSESIPADGVSFLTDHTDLIPLSAIIVPALPIHLAFEWLRRVLKESLLHRLMRVPEEVRPILPHTWEGREESLLVSYADFLCPDNCPEPADRCTVTGKRRDKPMYELLENLTVPGFSVHVIRSRQLAPGVGGYGFGDLKRLLERVESEGDSKWLVGTACRCHGVISALEIKRKMR